MAILDMIGRLVRKRAGAAPGEKAEPVDGADVLKYLTGEKPEEAPKTPGAKASVRPGRDQGALAVLQRAEQAALRRTEVAAPPFAEGSSAAERPHASAPVPVREPRVLELRDRTPREIPVRSRDPRPLESRPERSLVPTSAAASPADGPLPLPEAVPVGAVPARRRTPAVPPAPAPLRRSADLAGQLGLGGPGALRRAVLAREVLGPPLALRED